MDEVRSANLDKPVFPLSWFSKVNEEKDLIDILRSNSIDDSLMNVCKEQHFRINKMDLVHSITLLQGCPTFAYWIIK
jgi:hypothetical protein